VTSPEKNELKRGGLKRGGQKAVRKGKGGFFNPAWEKKKKGMKRQ